MDTKRKDRRNILIIGIVGLAVRMLALPFSQMIEADAVTRTWLAINWMDDPNVILAGRQGPLHLYLLAFSILIGRDPVWSPVVLHILFSVGTAVVLYLFARIEFESEKGSLMVGLAFALYPVAVRNSLSAMPETIFVFFLALTIYFMVRSFRQPESCYLVVLAGLSLTLAGMIRYEGWALIPLLGVLLIRDWRKMIVFGLVASLFPLSWLLGNQLEYSNALYSMQWSSNWELNIVGANEGLTTFDYVERAGFYPLVLVLGLTPLMAFASFCGAVRALWQRHQSARWLLPTAGLLAAMVYFAIQGSLDTQARYTLSLGMFTLPYLAWVYDNWQLDKKRKQWVFAGLLVLMLPLGYLGNLIPPARNFYLAGINPVPQLSAEAQKTSEQILEAFAAFDQQGQTGIISDFYGYRETYYVMGETRLDPGQLYVAPAEKYEELVPEELVQVLAEYPRGLLVLLEGSSFSALVTDKGSGGIPLIGIGLSLQLQAEIPMEDGSIIIYAYQVK